MYAALLASGGTTSGIVPPTSTVVPVVPDVALVDVPALAGVDDPPSPRRRKNHTPPATIATASTEMSTTSAPFPPPSLAFFVPGPAFAREVLLLALARARAVDRGCACAAAAPPAASRTTASAAAFAPDPGRASACAANWASEVSTRTSGEVVIARTRSSEGAAAMGTGGPMRSSSRFSDRP